MTFTNNDPACGDPNLLSRLTLVYGPVALDWLSTIELNFDYNLATPQAYNFVYQALVTFSIQGGNGRCYLLWYPTTIIAPEVFYLSYNQPTCGPNAPPIIDSSDRIRGILSIAAVTTPPDQTVSFFGDGRLYKTLFAAVYGVDESAVSLNMISYLKFGISITTNPDSPTADDSCVYEYVARQRDVILRQFTLVKYSLGSQTLLPGASIDDGCILTAVQTERTITFTNLNDALCGPSSSRFERYFGSRNLVVNWRVLDMATGVYNVSTTGSSTNPGDAVFYYHDMAFPTSTSTTTTSTSTFTITSTAEAATETTSTSSTTETQTPTETTTSSTISETTETTTSSTSETESSTTFST
ncbi:hypothetical protein HDU99_002182, partial [Rhizoclosmatium hyalinum]